jgi:hypothetical protein
VKEPLSIRFLAEEEYEAWDGLAAEAPEGSPYHSTAYLKALCEATGGTFRIVTAGRGSDMLGGVTLYQERSRAGVEVAPRLLLYYSGIVVRASESKYPSQKTARQIEILGALEPALRQLGCARLRLRCRSPFRDARVFQDAGWTVRPSYSYVVTLSDLSLVRQRMEQNLRRLVDRCARQGVTLTEDDDFPSFFRMHLETHARKGAPLYLPQAAFAHYFLRLRALGLMRLYHARLPDGRSISAQLVLASPHPVAHTVSASADAEFLALGATAFLRFKVFEDLNARGYQANDLTDAALNPVTHFKSQLGGDLELALTLEAPLPLSTRIRQLGSGLAGGLVRRVRRGLPSASPGD